MIYIKLFFEFFKIGLFTFGGGMATIPYLIDLAEKTGWYEVESIPTIIAVSEPVPGPIGLNMATHVGYQVAGIAGAILATIGEILPSIIIIVLVSRFIVKFKDNITVSNAFNGIRPSVAGLLLAVGLSLLYGSVMNHESINYLNLVLFIITMIGIRKYKLHPAVYTFTLGFLGIILKLK